MKTNNDKCSTWHLMLASHWFVQSWSFCHGVYSINLWEHIDCTNLELMCCVIQCFLASVVVQLPVCLSHNARETCHHVSLSWVFPSYDGGNFRISIRTWSAATLTTITCNYLYPFRHACSICVYHSHCYQQFLNLMFLPSWSPIYLVIYIKTFSIDKNYCEAWCYLLVMTVDTCHLE